MRDDLVSFFFFYFLFLLLFILYSIIIYYNIYIDVVTGKFWTSIENRREFFDKIATNHHFDPLLPHSWYNLAKSVVKAEMVHIFYLSLSSSSSLYSFVYLFVNFLFFSGRFVNAEDIQWVTEPSVD